MKGIFKAIIIIGILVAILGGATVKGYLNKGVNAGVDYIEQGVGKVKKEWDKNKDNITSNIKEEAGRIVNEAMNGNK